METDTLDVIAVTEEITARMKKVIAAAEHVDVDTTFSVLTRDPAGIFFVNNKQYSLDGLLELFRATYGTLDSQQIHITRADVIVFCPDAAMWIGYGEGRSISRAGVSMTYSFTDTWIWRKIQGEWVVTHYHETAG